MTYHCLRECRCTQGHNNFTGPETLSSVVIVAYHYKGLLSVTYLAACYSTYCTVRIMQHVSDSALGRNAPNVIIYPKIKTYELGDRTSIFRNTFVGEMFAK